jgi:hypothetical protein
MDWETTMWDDIQDDIHDFNVTLAPATVHLARLNRTYVMTHYTYTSCAMCLHCQTLIEYRVHMPT